MFGPEKDYEQVLAEAKKHLATKMESSSSNPPSSFTRSNSSRKPKYEGLVSHPKYEDASKSGRSWKDSLFFWRKPKKLDLSASSYSKCNKNTQQHYPMNSRKVNSGPIYSDGVQTAPSNKNNARKPRSGPLGGSSFIPSSNKRAGIQSPYVPLHRPSRIPQGPMYYAC